MWFNSLPNDYLQISFGDGEPKILSPDQQRELGKELARRGMVEEYDVTGYDPEARAERSHY